MRNFQIVNLLALLFAATLVSSQRQPPVSAGSGQAKDTVVVDTTALNSNIDQVKQANNTLIAKGAQQADNVTTIASVGKTSNVKTVKIVNGSAVTSGSAKRAGDRVVLTTNSTMRPGQDTVVVDTTALNSNIDQAKQANQAVIAKGAQQADNVTTIASVAKTSNVKTLKIVNGSAVTSGSAKRAGDRVILTTNSTMRPGQDTVVVDTTALNSNIDQAKQANQAVIAEGSQQANNAVAIASAVDENGQLVVTSDEGGQLLVAKTSTVKTVKIVDGSAVTSGSAQRAGDTVVLTTNSTMNSGFLLCLSTLGILAWVN